MGKSKREKLLKQIRKIYKELDEIAIAGEIEKYIDISEARSLGLGGQFLQDICVDLNGRDAFEELIKNVSRGSYLYGFSRDASRRLDEPTVDYDYDRYFFMLDDHTVLNMELIEKKYVEDVKPNQFKFTMEAYCSRGPLKLDVNANYKPGVSMIDIIDTGNNQSVYYFTTREDYSTYNGKPLTSVIKPIHLGDYISKGEGETTFQKH